MDAYKEFQSKTLDSAIEAACSYFNSAREKLEIEIVSDAKTGIFGLVGAKKAKIRARRMQVAFDNETTNGGSSADAQARDRKKPVAARDDRVPREERTPREERAPRDDRKPRDKGREQSARSGEQVEPKSTEQSASRPDGRSDQRAGQRSEKRQPPREDRPEGGERKPERKAEDRTRTEGRPERRPDRTDRPERPERSDRSRGGRNPKKPGDLEATSTEVAGELDIVDQQGTASDEERSSASRRSRGGRRRSRGGRGRGRREDGSLEEGMEAKTDVPQSNGVGTEVEFEASFDDDSMDDISHEPIPEANLAELDQDKLVAVVTEVVSKLIFPVIGETPIVSEIEENRVKVTISSGENSGLLIGREGQTLAAFQYLTNRIVAKNMGVAVRIQLDTGDYRERQDDKLREIALHLADKAKTLGKPQSTRPLSSYHRRIVHLVLQGDDEIQTRSKGDGPLKRVIIGRKRKSA